MSDSAAHRVFISYASEDSDVLFEPGEPRQPRDEVARLDPDFIPSSEDAGRTIEVIRRAFDPNAMSHEQIWATIQKKLDAADALLVLWSQSWLGAWWCVLELDYFSTQHPGRPILLWPQDRSDYDPNRACVVAGPSDVEDALHRWSAPESPSRAPYHWFTRPLGWVRECWYLATDPTLPGILLASRWSMRRAHRVRTIHAAYLMILGLVAACVVPVLLAIALPGQHRPVVALVSYTLAFAALLAQRVPVSFVAVSGVFGLCLATLAQGGAYALEYPHHGLILGVCCGGMLGITTTLRSASEQMGAPGAQSSPQQVRWWGPLGVWGLVTLIIGLIVTLVGGIRTPARSALAVSFGLVGLWLTISLANAARARVRVRMGPLVAVFTTMSASAAVTLALIAFPSSITHDDNPLSGLAPGLLAALCLGALYIAADSIADGGTGRRARSSALVVTGGLASLTVGLQFMPPDPLGKELPVVLAGYGVAFLLGSFVGAAAQRHARAVSHG